MATSRTPSPSTLSVDTSTAGLLIYAGRLLNQQLGAELGKIGVSAGQLPVLLALFEQDGLTQAELARAVDIEQPTMALTLRRMERDGLVTRTRDAKDARRSHVKLTGAAKRKKPAIARIRAKVEAGALAAVSITDRSKLKQSLGKVVAGLSDS